jgi:hypothetical protein
MNSAWVVIDWSAVSSLCTVIALTYSLPALLVGLVLLLRRPALAKESAQQTIDRSK